MTRRLRRQVSPGRLHHPRVSELLAVLTALRSGDSVLVEAALADLTEVGVAARAVQLSDVLVTALAVATGATPEVVLERMALIAAAVEASS